ncbi:MAG TPA: aminotransferase class V-fold PLP-dependent enzyme [Planctomycetaceae bacterium]|nr:aminotransferase [Blastopirellula sp.]HAY80427.1 aminotransferase class V-fold PLP-dependent enzyme [Planctomycetaceae bacterium]
MNRIYLDNAATSWPKPDAVYASVDRYLRQNGAPAGRGQSHEAAEVSRQIAQLRTRIAELLGAPHAGQIVFTFNGTDSLNLAIRGIVRSGDHVITTQVEHNSTLRPLRSLEQQGEVELTIVRCDDQGMIDVDDVRAQIKPNTALIALNHVSNVTGTIQPAQAIGKLAREHDLVFLLDAAQSLGHMPVDLQQINCDLLAAPGHKGLLGPLGTGILYVAERLVERLAPLRLGGTGTKSELMTQPESMPDKFEAGNHNVPGLLGLGAGVQYLNERSIADLERHERSLTKQLLDALEATEGVRVQGPSQLVDRLGVVSFQLGQHEPGELATLLEMSAGVQGRPGLHCAPLIHQALGTADQGGTMRLSVGAFTTTNDVVAAIEGIRQLATMSLDF